MERVVEIFDLFVLPVRREGVLDEIVGSDAEEARSPAQTIGAERGAGRLDHDANRDVARERDALSHELVRDTGAGQEHLVQLGDSRDQRKHDSQRAKRGRAQDRA